MLDRSLTPSITVTIGRDTRLYFGLSRRHRRNSIRRPRSVARRHAAGTVLLRGGPFSLDTTRSRYASRLVLVDAFQRAWQCANYEGNGHC